VWTVWRCFRDPYGTPLRLFARFGDPFTMSLNGIPTVTTADPELIRTILGADPAGFDAFGKDLFGPVMGNESLILLDGEPHRAARKLLAPPFHGARMRAYAQAMQEIAVDEARRWPAGAAVTIQRATQSISLRVILRAVLGIDDPEESRRWEQVVVDVITALKPSLMFFKWLQRDFGGLGPWARLQRITASVEAMVYEELRRRRAEPGTREDILSLIMAACYDDGTAMSDRQVFETMMTLIIAGHETTAIALAWALWLIHRQPEVLAQLRDELRQAGDDAEAWTRLPYLEAVCQETLRLHPVATSVVRVLSRPLRLGDWELPVGVAVSPSIIGLHRRPELYPQPEAFLPERFVERSFAPWEFLPFGGGHRRCIGAAFALFEMKIVLAGILRQRQLRLVDERPIPIAQRNTVVGPGRPIALVAN
jgi:cytochrome P450